ncbi:NAD(+)/NADH kinase [Candidatus Curtissbacteria bacterium]|nr:NAD(+)/NADH kinase [Candidatus Curtissbacteria bacterium]
MKFGIISAKDIGKAGEVAFKIGKYLTGRGHQVLDKNLDQAEILVTLGGDGMLLHTACKHVELGVPFVGINVGTLGFLTAAEADEWQEAIEKIIGGKYFVSERMTLDAKVESAKLKVQSFRALNEIVVKGQYRVVDLEILVNNQKFLTIRGDGVLVSTPTGSTAYSLSAGGPIVDPELDSILITPVNAHGLPIPSVVLAPEDEVEIKIVRGDDVSLTLDGQEHVKVLSGQSVKVLKGKHRVKLIYFDRQQFLKSLNAKFGLASRLAGS